jgi:Tol biopolymer transport system component
MPSGGGTAVRLTTTAANEGDPALSPDGTRLAYTRDDGGVPRLWIAAANGSGAVRVTDSLDFGGAIDVSPTWSPGSDRVVFVSTTSGSARLYQLTLSGLTITPILPDTAPDVEPSWSPDGVRVAFASGAGGGARIAILNLTSHAVSLLTPATSQNGQPVWLPDGRLVFLQEGSTPALAWIDPAAPDQVHAIAIGPGSPGHPAAIRP